MMAVGLLKEALTIKISGYATIRKMNPSSTYVAAVKSRSWRDI
jgi:hypothetical protein